MSLTFDRIISQSQLRKLLRQMEVAKNDSIRRNVHLGFITDYYMVALTAYCGLRISELASLTWGNVNLNEGFLIVENGKGGKKRHVIFGKKVKTLLTEYQNHFQEVFGKPLESDNRLFFGQRGPLTPSGIHQRWVQWKKRTGLTKAITYHSLRHYHATFLLDNGVPLAAVRDQLGHSNISTTSIYTHFTAEAKERLASVL